MVCLKKKTHMLDLKTTKGHFPVCQAVPKPLLGTAVSRDPALACPRP